MLRCSGSRSYVASSVPPRSLTRTCCPHAHLLPSRAPVALMRTSGIPGDSHAWPIHRHGKLASRSYVQLKCQYTATVTRTHAPSCFQPTAGANPFPSQQNTTSHALPSAPQPFHKGAEEGVLEKLISFLTTSSFAMSF